MISTKLSLIALLLLADSFVCDDIFTTLCSRILFQQPQNSEEFLYKEVINGIYIKTNKVVNNFPLYENERGSISFQYNKILNAFYFTKSIKGESVSLGLGAEADLAKINNPKSWVNMADKKNNVFGGVVTKWFQYRINKIVYLKENINITCSNSTDCLFRDLIFNYKIYFINDPLIDYFTPVDNLYSFNRQVYKHSNYHFSKWYLYYLDSHWIIGPRVEYGLDYWTVFDQALKPEFITNNWRRYGMMINYGKRKKWEEYVGVTFQCRGLNKPCSNNRCTMNGVCNLNQYNRSTCTCFFNYTGDDCNKKNEVCKSDVEVANIEAGSLRANFCLSNDEFNDVLCSRKVSGDYAWTSLESCSSRKTPSTITATAITTKAIPNKTFNIDEIYFIQDLLIIFSPILPIFGPILIRLITVEWNILRITSVWWYLSMIMLLCFKSVAAIFGLQIYGPNFLSTMDTIAAISIPIFYLYVLIEAQFCNEKKYLDSIYDGDEIDHYLELIYEKEPRVVIIIECYHFETRRRFTTFTDANGILQPGDETYQEKVTTYTDSKMFNFRTWRDVSDRSLVLNSRTKVTRMKLSMKLTFADNQTLNEFSNIKSNFIEANRNRDIYINSYTKLNLIGFEERIFSVNSNRPFWMNKVCFQLANLLALSWPYRWLLSCCMQRIEHFICKEISIFEKFPPNTSLTAEINYPDESFQSEKTGLLPPSDTFSNNQEGHWRTNPTFLNDYEFEGVV